MASATPVPETLTPREVLDVNPLLLQGNADARGLFGRHFRAEDRIVSRAMSATEVAAMGMVRGTGRVDRYVAMDAAARRNMAIDLGAVRAALAPALQAAGVRAMQIRSAPVLAEIEAVARGDMRSLAFPPEYFSHLQPSDRFFAAQHAILTVLASEGVAAAGRSVQIGAAQPTPGFAIGGTTAEYRRAIQALLARLPAAYTAEPTGLVDRGTLAVAGVAFALVREDDGSDLGVPTLAHSADELVRGALEYEPVLAGRAADAATARQNALQVQIERLKRRGGTRADIKRLKRKLRHM